MIIVDFPQHSKEWWEARTGKPTASKFGCILTATGKRSEQRKDYLFQLAGERLIHGREAGFSNWTTEKGTEEEPNARALYELINNCDVEEVGFALSDCGKYGASPDGKRTDCNVGLEIKCKTLKVATKYLFDGKTPTEFKPQIQGQIQVWGFDAVHFFSYYEGMKPLQVVNDPDLEYLALQKEALEEFCFDLDELMAKLL